MTAAIRVVDASALAALLFGEPEADAIKERLMRIERPLDGMPLVVSR